ncbi:MAG: GAF domain-containing protein [Chloroflexota bacterium]|nr:GAF domain-containing protein [Chloroflexota bacterium]
MTGWLGSLKWLVILGSVVFAAISLPAFFSIPLTFSIAILTIAIVAISFSKLVFSARSRRERELIARRRIAIAVSSSLETNEILARALDVILESTHAAAGRVWLVEPDENELRNTLQRGLFSDMFAEPPVLKFGDDLAGRVAQSARAERITDSNRLPNAAWLRDKGFVELVSVPLIARDRVVGVIDIAARHRGELGATTEDLLLSIGREVGLAIENARLFEAARDRQADAENLHKTGMEVSSKLQLGQVLDTVTARGRDLLNVDASALCLWDSQSRWLVVGSESGPADAFESQQSIGQRVAQRINMLRVDAAHPDDCITCALIRAPYRVTHIEMPLQVGNHVIGCLCVSSARSRVFSEREIQVLSGLANQAAIAIENARAYDHAGNVAVALERERLAREMHDTLAQVLGFVNTKSQAVRVLMDAGRIDAAREQIDQLTELSQELSADVREVILGLRTALSPEKRLLPALADYVQAYAKQSGIDTQMVVDDGARDLTFAPAVELQMIRIVQESLTNVRKHAHAQHALVRFSMVDGHAEMRVEDDGRGFDPARIARGDWPQFGLQTMRERAESVGGAFVIVSRPNLGTQIVVQIPLRYSGHAISSTQTSHAQDTERESGNVREEH